MKDFSSSSNASDSISLYFGYDGRPHPAILGWLLFCFTGLTLQVRLLLNHFKSKPPVMVSLVDLVNGDVVRAAFLFGCGLLLPYFVANLGLRILYLPAIVISVFAPIAVQVVLVYLTVAAVVQSLLMRLRATSLNDSLSDEQACVAIRATVLLFSSTTNAVRVLTSAQHRDSVAESIVYPLVITPNTFDVSTIAETMVHTHSTIVLVCVITNVLLRGWMYWKKKTSLQEDYTVPRHVSTDGSCPAGPLPPAPSSDGIYNQLGNYLAQYSWTIVIIVFVALSIGIMGVSLLQWEGQQSVAPLLRLFLAIPTVCLGMPLSLILSEKKLKQTVLKRAKSVCFNCKTKVAPMLNQ